MLLQKNLSRKISPEKNRSIFGLKNQSCDRRYVMMFFARNELCEVFPKNQVRRII